MKTGRKIYFFHKSKCNGIILSFPVNDRHLILNTEKATVNPNNVFQLHDNSCAFMPVRKRTGTGSQTSIIQKYFSAKVKGVEKSDPFLAFFFLAILNVTVV